jgi:hypothetical protein
MKFEEKIDALGYLSWYMDLLAIHISLFGNYSTNYCILVNKISLLCKLNNIDLDTFDVFLQKSKLPHVGITHMTFTSFNELVTENMN